MAAAGELAVACQEANVDDLRVVRYDEGGVRGTGVPGDLCALVVREPRRVKDDGRGAATTAAPRTGVDGHRADRAHQATRARLSMAAILRGRQRRAMAEPPLGELGVLAGPRESVYALRPLRGSRRARSVAWSQLPALFSPLALEDPRRSAAVAANALEPNLVQFETSGLEILGIRYSSIPRSGPELRAGEGPGIFTRSGGGEESLLAGCCSPRWSTRLRSRGI
jgi:hypothetical protein